MTTISSKTIYTVEVSVPEIGMIIEGLEALYENAKAEYFDEENHVYTNMETVEKILKLKEDFYALI